MKLDESSPIERKDVERAAKRWAHRWYRNASSRGPDLTDKFQPSSRKRPKQIAIDAKMTRKAGFHIAFAREFSKVGLFLKT